MYIMYNKSSPHAGDALIVAVVFDVAIELSSGRCAVCVMTIKGPPNAAP